MKMLNLKLLTAGSLAVLAGASTGSAWTVAVDNFESYEDGTPLKDQVDHGGVGFDGDWTETFGLDFWVPLYGTSTTKVFDGAVTQDGLGVMTSGGRHMRTLAHPQSSGVVYASVLMIETVEGGGSSQFHLNSDTPITDGEGNVTNGPADIIGGVRYTSGVLQIIDTSFVHVPNDPDTPEDESRNLDAIIPGRDGFTDDDPPKIAYNEYYTLAETYVDIAGRDVPLSTSILWVMKYDIDASTISYYAFLPGDDLTPEGASYSVPDHPVAEARKLTLGNISIAAFSEAVLYEFVKVGTTWKDVVPVYNNFAQAPMLRAPITVDGEIDAAWDTIPEQGYGLKTGDGSQPASEADASGSWKAAWDDDYLYLLFEVIDDEHFEGDDGRQDEIEFWTDTNFARNNTDAGWPPVYDNTDTQWITRFIDGSGNGFANRWQHGSSGLPADRKDITGLGDDSMVVEGVVEDIDGGVRKTVEVSVSWTDLAMDGPPAFGRLIGFETHLNDRDATTGNNAETGDPLYASDGKAAWADATNRAWVSPSTMGVLEFIPPVTPILDYDFSDLTVEQPAAGAGMDDDNWTGPWIEVWNIFGVVANGAEADPFVGDLAQSGQGIVGGGGAGRLSRTMDTVFDSGVVWTSLVLGNATGSNQFWFGDSSKFDLNDSSGIIAGVRMQNGAVQIIDTTLDRNTKESYINAGVWPNAPILLVVMMDYDTGTVGYWIFESGLPIDPGNPSAFYEFTLPRNMALESFSGVAWASFSASAVVSSLRVGDQLVQVVPGSGMQYNCPVLVNELHEAVTLDGSVVDFAWERTNGLELTEFWSDGGKNVLPSDEADLSAAFHTGWNGDNLYIAVLVDDEDVRNSVTDGSRDTVEIYLDGDNSDSPSLGWPTNYDEVDDFQLVFALNADREEGADITGAWFGNPTGNPDGYKGGQGANPGQDFAGITWQVSLTESGYVLEIALDMTVVPGLDTFLANGLMGLDVAVIDFDDTGEVDEEGAAVIAKSHVFFCDDASWNWNGTAHFGTAYVAGAKPAIAMFGDGLANVALAGDAASGNGIYEVNANFTDVAYTIAANQPWATIDFDPGAGAGEVEFSWEENTGLYRRAARIQLSGARALNRINLTQAGIAPEAMKPFFPGATPGASAGWASTYLGDVLYGDFPWVYADSMQWLHAYEGSTWMYSIVIADYLHTTEAIWPLLYVYGAGSQSSGWKYALEVEESGIYLYDYATGLYSDDPVFP